MVGNKTLFWGMTVALVLTLATACSPASPTALTGSEQAIEALEAFFERLSKEDYAGAAELYGGSYETLVNWNPEIPESNTESLWQKGCQINGLQCLTVRSAKLVEESDGELVFTVEFNNPDGELFVQGPCCGADETQMPPASQFQVRLQKTPQGGFLVLDMPVYVP